MKLLIYVALFCGALVFLPGCAGGIDGALYRQQQPVFNLYDFFDGPVKAWGIVQNRSGEVVQRFTVDIEGKQKGSQLELNESFNYQLGDGPASRIWTISRVEDTIFRGDAGDILGSATGQSYGNAFNFQYKMDLPVDDTTYEVTFDDWFFALGADTMMNRSYIKKFGIVMAEVTIFMQKQQDTVL
ncbi:DUF3833 domain-containing protein [Aestuariibacter sp. A3R04]|uniref:DUF3833 domain-containing protein n=1 Tax=Aestuariibacter sp. A3R04 TaxID=2841571 RepID=UPI001C098039|nr:DUF3833 domain-containing protein [Aestuariibacter sp. A3R04]MBU3021469.1 DUF3833 domain-containing protein [Aestuariibacter sp. A3R04]